MKVKLVNATSTLLVQNDSHTLKYQKHIILCIIYKDRHVPDFPSHRLFETPRLQQFLKNATPGRLFITPRLFGTAEYVK